jgi:hypothetical protein
MTGRWGSWVLQFAYRGYFRYRGRYRFAVGTSLFVFQFVEKSVQTVSAYERLEKDAMMKVS